MTRWPRGKSSPRNRGGQGSTELAIVVPRRSWLEISGEKSNNTQLAPSDHGSTKSEDGRAATEATWLNGKQFGKGRNKEKERKNRKMKEKPRHSPAFSWKELAPSLRHAVSNFESGR
jgi:hypothetical protein